MADTKLTGLSALAVPTLDDLLYIVDDPAGTPASKKIAFQIAMGYTNSVCNGRLTLESGVPVSTTDQTAKTNLFFCPYGGRLVSLYNGSAWQLYVLAQVTLALGTLTSDKNYDAYLFDNSGTLTLELTAWTNDTTRATALATQDGILVKTGSLTHRYVGTIRTTSTTTTEDSAAKRYVWNAQNLVTRPVKLIFASSTWAATGATWGPVDASVGGGLANRVSAVIGLAGCSLINFEVCGTIQQTAAIGNNAFATLGIGRDSVGGSTSSNDADVTQRWGLAAVLTGGVEVGTRATLREYVALGFHFYQALQWDDAAPGITVLFVGTDTSTNSRIAGIVGSLFC